MKKYILFLLSSLLFIHCGPSTEITKKELLTKRVNTFSDELLSGRIIGPFPPSVKLNEIKIDEPGRRITLVYNKDFSYIPFREDNVEEIYRKLSDYTDGEYTFSVETMNYPIEQLVPNFFRENNIIDTTRIPSYRPAIPFVNRTTFGTYDKGLSGRNIILWHSHGWYYSQKESRWEWQRPRLFQTVEDLIPLSFTVPFLIPMLENAGANVFVPRERDFQKNEVIVDNSDKTYIESLYSPDVRNGFGPEGYGQTSVPLTAGVNPFIGGSTRFISTDTVLSAQAEWIPDIPETGNYSVYISYAASERNTDKAHYIISYYGGQKDFYLNQRIGGGTWIYLGTFKFLKGVNPSEGKVILSNKSNIPGEFVSADAVRFGGGMGVVERGGSVSGRAKFFEGARYWLQYAGMPDTLVYNLNKDNNDYNDDYQSRGEYGNYLKGAPSGPNKDRSKGLGIPMDISLAFHTDAGITHNDTVIGTLAIYSLQGADSSNKFPDGVHRLASRDLSDIIQTEIVDNLSFLYDPAWQRRNLWESQYSEAFRPNMPAMLLELLSHQNFLDMQYVLDPRFRFDVSRAIYKGMLKFLSTQYNYDYVVQPLPVDHFLIEFTNETAVRLKWKAQIDPLEPTSVPDRFILYTRIDDKDFDTGELLYTDNVTRTLEPGRIYSFKVTAVNDGGESFPSEILAAGIPKGSNKGKILIVNGFDRISGPAAVSGGSFAGFINDIDDGVPYKYDFGFTGRQYDYDINSDFVNNDAPGHGASRADYETEIIAGNSFDYPYMHGKAIFTNGYSFCSSSDEAFAEMHDAEKYIMIDYVLGEEKETEWQKSITDSVRGKQFKAFTPGIRDRITEYLSGGGNLFISGSYLGSELYSDTVTAKFARDILKLKNNTTHASSDGKIKSAVPEFAINFKFNTILNDSIYAVNSPGSINHTGEGLVLLRYAENEFSAAVGYKKEYSVAAFGFPFETILGEEARSNVMQGVLKFLGL